MQTEPKFKVGDYLESIDSNGDPLKIISVLRDVDNGDIIYILDDGDIFPWIGEDDAYGVDVSEEDDDGDIFPYDAYGVAVSEEDGDQ